MLHRLQSAIEFLSVYGFVILIIAIVLTLLVLLSGLPKTAIPIQCSFFTEFVCNDAIYTINTVSNTGSVLIIAAADTEPGALNVSSFTAFMGFRKSTSGYCVPNVAQQGQTIYCIANFNLTPILGNTYSGTFNIHANYCAVAPNLINNVTCPANGNYTFGGAVTITAGRFTVSGIPAGATGLHNVTITMYNNQQSAIPAHFQTMIRFLPSSSLYKLLERYDLGNIRFYYNSKELFSWCESGCNYSSTSNAVFWVELPVAIPPRQNMSIRMYFAPLSVDYDGVYAGEAPQLSGTYAQYDNGASVFDFYDNFAGTTLSSTWTLFNGASASVNSGLTLTDASNNGGIFASMSSSKTVMESYAYFNKAGGNSGLMIGNGTASTTDFQNGYLYWYQSAVAYIYVAVSGAFTTIASGGTMPSGKHIFGAVLVDSSQVFSADYTNYASASNTQFTPSQITQIGYRVNTGVTMQATWVRTRAYPTNGVMPSVVFGTLV